MSWVISKFINFPCFIAKDNIQLNVKALNRNHLKNVFVSLLEGVTNVNIIIIDVPDFWKYTIPVCF